MAGFFGNLDDPTNQMLLAAGLQMMAQSGAAPVKRTLGEIIGAGGLTGMQAYNQRKKSMLLENEDKRQEEELKVVRQLRQMQMEKLRGEMEEPAQLAEFASDPSNLFKLGIQRSEGDIPEGQMGPGDLVETQVAVPRNQTELAYRMLMSKNKAAQKEGVKRLLGENGKPIVAGNVVLSADGTRILYEPPKDGGDQWERLDSTTPGGQLMQRNKRTGEIRPIGSGPPQPSAVSVQLEGRDNARKNVSGLVSTLQQYYDDLDAAGGAVKAGQSPVENAINLGMNSPPGQYLGRALGTQAQIARDGIAAMRPALINEIRQATGMSARAMDSNVELQFNIKMATDPGVDPSVNRAALERIDKAHGLGWGISSTPEGRNKLNNITKKNFSGSNPLSEQGGLKRGQKVGDYVYLGGDPNNPSSWAKTP